MGNDADFMGIAISRAREGISKGQGPFGACIARDGRMIASAHDTVRADTDGTAHAVVNAIRRACRALGTVDLTGCYLYATCEPCPMCFTACHWTGVTRIIHGADIADALRAGFNELSIPARVMAIRGGSPIGLVPGFMREECVGLFGEWMALCDRRYY